MDDDTVRDIYGELVKKRMFVEMREEKYREI